MGGRQSSSSSELSDDSVEEKDHEDVTILITLNDENTVCVTESAHNYIRRKVDEANVGENEDFLQEEQTRSPSYQVGLREEEFVRMKQQLEREKNKNKELKKITASEIEGAASEIRSILSERVPQIVPVCEDVKNKIAECFLANPQKPLLCCSQVEEYKQCVRKARGPPSPNPLQKT